VIYTLEFYWVDENGRQEPLARQTQTAESAKVVEARAKATLKNVLLSGRRANLCIIKDSSGHMLSAAVTDYKLGGGGTENRHVARRSTSSPVATGGLPAANV
jgi:hypothetical protein